MREDAVEALSRSFLLGTARQAAPVGKALAGLVDPADAKADLKALALLGQRQRFARRSAPRPAEAAPLFADPHALPAPALRPVLVSLLTGKNGRQDDALAAAIADALARRRIKLHPFDLPRLDAFAREHRETLGASAIAWAERRAAPAEKDDPDGYFFIETIDESNWRRGRPAQKAAFIRELRRRQAGQARDLVAAALPSEPAPVRLVLVKALAVGLGPEDGHFLEALAGDRAPTVREAAEALLVRLPGSPQAAKRLQEAMSRIKTAKTGFFRHKRTLSLEFPATIQTWQRGSWAFATLGGLGLATLAASLGFSIEEMAAAAAEDEVLSTVLAMQAVVEGQFGLLPKFGGRVNLWDLFDLAEDLDLSAAGAGEAFAAALVQPEQWSEMPAASALSKLYLVLRRPLPRELFERILVSGAWRACRAKAGEAQPASFAELLCALAALCPPMSRADLRLELAGFDLAVAGRARAALDALGQIDAS